MNYKETLDFLFSQLPIYQRVGAAAYKDNLDNTIAIAKLLGNPEKKFKSIHIAGTNGKGSVSHLLASVLQEAGYKTGLYTSPHFKDFRERIKINGEMIPESEVVNFVETNKEMFNSIQPSFFEYTFGLAIDYFAKRKVDIAIMETGMGGRLDSTNIIQPEISVITNIGMDHMQFLGDTLEKISIEKAGIIKTGVPLVIGETQEEIKHVFIEKAEKLKTSISFADQNYSIKKSGVIQDLGPLKKILIKSSNHQINNYLTPLLPKYQEKNIVTALQSIAELQKIGWKINEENLREGLKNVIKNTGLKGRWQIISDQPLTICDSGHNEDGVKAVLNQLSKLKFEKLHIIWGMVNDKSIAKVLSMLPNDATYYFCKANVPRGMNAKELFEKAEKFNLTGSFYQSVNEALIAAWQQAKENDLIFVGGSTFVVAEVV